MHRSSELLYTSVIIAFANFAVQKTKSYVYRLLVYYLISNT